MAVEAEKWARAFEGLGWRVRRVAGEGPVDVVVPGLAMDAPTPPTREELDRALAGADLVVVENLCSLPLNPAAAAATAAVLHDRPAILHHHDLPWQRPNLPLVDSIPPDDEAWAHVTVSELARRELACRGIDATTIYNAFDIEAGRDGNRPSTRAALFERAGAEDDGRPVVLQPTRAIARKNVAAAIALADAIGALYWLLGPAEEGYGPELERLVASARVPVVVGRLDGAGIADDYAACDVVAFPSTNEGFGNPPLEAALHRRPVMVGDYAVARELRERFGFHWFAPDDAAPLEAWLRAPDATLLDQNEAIVCRHFSLAQLQQQLAELLERRGWTTR